ncbi:tyrosine-type recombinase/integrase [Myroides odoratus]|uniref:tyrosine-type recombinase/integrase n=1 Tax=Myroides odoratus TaxID=256 RepID=UPI0039B0E7E2
MIESTLKQFYDYLVIKGYQEETSRNRYWNVCHFLGFIKKDFLQVTEADVKQYYAYLKHRPNKIKGQGILKDSSIQHHMRCIELFYIFLFEFKKTNYLLQLDLPKSQETDDFVREILSQGEVQQLYATASLKERVMLHLGYGCGLRVSELVAVNKEDLYLKENLLLVPKGKNNKRRIIPFTQKMQVDFVAYLAKEPTAEQALIVNTKGRRMQEWTYNQLLKRLLDTINIHPERLAKISVHSLRHSIATHFLSQGMELEQVREFLGHEQLKTTEIYTHIDSTQLKNLQDEEP